jgi:putative ABC transport system permease protein
LGAGLQLTGWGIVIGSVGALWLTHFLSGMLFQVGPRDPSVFVGVAAVLIGAATLACVVPALRAGRADVATLLREE